PARAVTPVRSGNRKVICPALRIRSARKDRPLSRCWPSLRRGQAIIAARPNEIDEIAAVGVEKKSRNREMSRIPGAPAYVYTDMGITSVQPVDLTRDTSHFLRLSVSSVHACTATALA